jgi:hypothetical protein
MKRFLPIPLIVLGITTAAAAQDQTRDDRALSSVSAAVDAAGLSAPWPAATALSATESNRTEQATRTKATPPAQDSLGIAVAAPRSGLAALSFATAAPAASAVAAAHWSWDRSTPAGYPAAAVPKPYGYNERDYNLEIALGISVIRFRSSVYEATGVGFHSAAAFYFKDWLAVEGAVSSGFAPTIFAGENVKILTYGAGPKISLGRHRIEPWLHVLGGGIHALPQTALGGKNGFQVTTGVGVDYGLNPRLSLRVEGDYVGSRLFAQWQNNYQGIVAVVLHF